MTKLNCCTVCVDFTICLTALFAVSLAFDIDQGKTVGPVRDAPSLALDKTKETLNRFSNTPSPGRIDLDDSGALWSVVKKDDAVKVGVHVPIVFDLTKHEANELSKLDLSIFGGMFSFTKDKSKQPNGSMSGPTSVSLFGIPIYSATSVSPSIGDKINSFLADSDIIHPLTKLSRKIDPETSRNLLNKLQQKNQQVTSSLFGKLVKVTRYLSNQLQTTNINGAPVADASKYVFISNITQSDLLPKSLASLKSLIL